jgi:hypothetical protein
MPLLDLSGLALKLNYKWLPPTQLFDSLLVRIVEEFLLLLRYTLNQLPNL